MCPVIVQIERPCDMADHRINERIALDLEVLRTQAASLESASHAFTTSVIPARARISSTSFGVMNAGVVPMLNRLAEGTERVATDAATLCMRISENLVRTSEAFEELEDSLVAQFDRFAGQG